MKNANPFSNGQECRIGGMLSTLVVYFLLFLAPTVLQAQSKQYANAQNSGRRVQTTLAPSYTPTVDNGYATISNPARSADGDDSSFATLVAKALVRNLVITTAGY